MAATGEIESDRALDEAIPPGAELSSEFVRDLRTGGQ